MVDKRALVNGLALANVFQPKRGGEADEGIFAVKIPLACPYAGHWADNRASVGDSELERYTVPVFPQKKIVLKGCP